MLVYGGDISWRRYNICSHDLLKNDEEKKALLIYPRICYVVDFQGSNPSGI